MPTPCLHLVCATERNPIFGRGRGRLQPQGGQGPPAHQATGLQRDLVLAPHLCRASKLGVEVSALLRLPWQGGVLGLMVSLQHHAV